MSVQMSNRQHRTAVARETLDILTQGYYCAESESVVEIGLQLERACAGTVLYTPDALHTVVA